MTPPAGAPGRATTRERVREVFAGRPFRRLFAARAISQFGDGLFQLSAAAVLLFEDPGPNPALDLLGVTAIALVPFSAVGPFVGVFIDRWERRKILVRVPIARAAVAALAPLAALAGTRGPAFYAVVLVVLSTNRFFLATMGAVLPRLVPEDDLLVANSAATTGGSIANVAGQTLGFGLARALGGRWAGAFAALAFAVAALAARRIPAPRGHPAQRAPVAEELREVLAEMVEGLRRVARAPRVVYALAAVGVVQVLVGTMTGVLVFHFIRVLGLDVRDGLAVLGLLTAGIGAGVVLVPVAARRVRYDRLVPAGLAIACAGTAASGARFVQPVLLAGTFLVGVSYAFAKIPVDTIVQEEMGDDVRGRAFAAYDVLFNLARVAGVAIAAGAYAGGTASASLVLWIAGGYAVATAVFAAWERGIGRVPTTEAG